MFFLPKRMLAGNLARGFKLGRIGDGVVKGLSTDHPSFFSGTLVTSVHLSSPVPRLQVAKIPHACHIYLESNSPEFDSNHAYFY